MSEIKSELKAAKDAIKKKEYKEALKHCKNVMKIDKENYNALVFIGVCASELEQYEQSKQAYKRAIQQNEEQILAWQGLCSLFEKCKKKEWTEELVEAYEKLMQFQTSDNKKWLEYCSKLSFLLKANQKYDKVIDLLKESTTKQPTKAEVIGVWKEIYNTIQLVKYDKEELKIKELLEVHDTLIGLYQQDGENNHWEMDHVEYIEFLIKYGKSMDFLPISHILTKVTDVYNRYQTNQSILLLFCKVITSLSVSDNLNDLQFDILNKLTESDGPKSCVKYLSFGIEEYYHGNKKTALQHFQNALCIDKSNPLVNFYMASCYLSLHQYGNANHAIINARKSINNSLFIDTFNAIEYKLSILQLELMIEQNTVLKNKDLVDEMLENMNKSCVKHDLNNSMIVQAHIYLILNDVERANKILLEVHVDTDVVMKLKVLQIKALVSIHEEKLFDAEIRLQEAVELKETYKIRYLLGEVYWLMGEKNKDFYPKAYQQFLMAAKCDSNYARTFVYLGKYQQVFIKDQHKALKCFEKAFSLDNTNEDAMKYLGDIYMQLEYHDKAFGIYKMITSNAKVGEGIWAWVRLGLIYLKSNDPDNAVVCFQHAIRGDTGVSHYWECLAESYMAKGSYVSALRAFTKASQLDPTSLVAAYKIGRVKQMLSLDIEAIEVYKELLKNHPTYLPALVGLAETYVHLEKESLATRFDGRAIDYAQHVLDVITRSLALQPRYTCLWKTLGDSLTILYLVNQEKYKLVIPESLLKILSVEENNGDADISTIMEIGTRCYTMAIKLDENNATFWHDLAISTFHRGLLLGGAQGRLKVQQSVKLVKKALNLDSNNHVIWNTFGVITGASGPLQMCCGHDIDELDNPALSQHAFIKALNINNQDAQVWCNLGALYLKHSKIEPAHEAFKKAQACNPAYAQSWIGQAMIAETIANDDAMDLFRHSTELLFHGEGSLAYAQWVCNALKTLKYQSLLISTVPKPDMSHLPIHIRRIVSSAVVALVKSIDRLMDNPCAFNTLGILYEQEALYGKAENAFSCARKLLSLQTASQAQTDQLRMVLLNQARVLTFLGNFDDSIEIYKMLNLETTEELCQLGLTYFKACKYENSLEVYTRALTVATCEKDKSSILAVLGMINYVLHDAESAKTNLFKSAQLENCSSHGLLALAALGLLHGDVTLATASLVELSKQKFSNSESLEVKKAKLFSSFYILQGQPNQAQRTLTKTILRYPNNCELWCLLSKFIMQNQPNQYKLANQCIHAAKQHGQSEFTYQTEAMSSLAYPVENRDILMRSVQRLVHSYPQHAESWVALASMIQTLKISRKEKFEDNSLILNATKLALTKVDAQLNLLKSTQNIKENDKVMSLYTKLYSWIMKSYVFVNIHYGDKTLSQTLCTHIIPSLNTDTSEQEKFMFLKSFSVLEDMVENKESDIIEIIRMMTRIGTKQKDEDMWKFITGTYESLGYLEAAEICQRQQLQFNLQKNLPQYSLLMQMCWSYIKSFHLTSKRECLLQAQQLFEELQKQNGTHSYGILLRTLLFHYDGNETGAVKYLKKLARIDDPLITDIREKLSTLWGYNIEEKVNTEKEKKNYFEDED